MSIQTLTAKTRKIFIVDDDPIMAECLKNAARQLAGVAPQIFSDAVSAVQALDLDVPEAILLDILLDGPDGFTLLNELASYNDTAKIPVIIVSSLNLNAQDLSHYGVVKVFNKETMLPQQIIATLSEVLGDA